MYGLRRLQPVAAGGPTLSPYAGLSKHCLPGSFLSRFLAALSGNHSLVFYDFTGEIEDSGASQERIVNREGLDQHPWHLLRAASGRGLQRNGGP